MDETKRQEIEQAAQAAMPNTRVSVVNGIGDFFSMIMGQQNGVAAIAQQVADECSIPFVDDRKTETPTSYNDVQEALDRIVVPTAVYYNYQKMNLVIVDQSGELVGIRSISLRELDGEQRNVQALIAGLKAKLVK